MPSNSSKDAAHEDVVKHLGLLGAEDASQLMRQIAAGEAIGGPTFVLGCQPKEEFDG